MMTLRLNEIALRKACHQYCQAIRYRQNSVDQVLASAEVQVYFDEAKKIANAISEQGEDPNIIVRAVGYLGRKHAIPPTELDIRAFSTMLEVLIELAHPTSGVQDDLHFMSELESGIQEARNLQL
jgi:hypothetical protein